MKNRENKHSELDRDIVDVVLKSMKMLFAYTAISLPPAIIFPRESFLPTAASASLLLGAVVYLNKDKAKVEADAYNAQKKALKMKLINPYNFAHETG